MRPAVSLGRASAEDLAVRDVVGEQSHLPGFITSAAVIVVLSALLYLTFKRRDWL